MALGEEAKKNAILWFNTLKAELDALGLDLNNPTTSLKLRTINLDENGEFDSLESPLNLPPHNYNVNVIFEYPSLNKISNEQIYALYEKAMANNLILLNDKGDLFSSLAIYIKDDKTAGIGPQISTCPIEGEMASYRKDRNDPDLMLEDVLAESFPGVEDAEKLSLDYKDMYLKLNTGLTTEIVDNGYEELSKFSWEREVLIDREKHPEFYATPEFSKERSELIKDNVRAQYASEKSDWGYLSLKMAEHPVDYYDGTVDAITKLGFDVHDLVNGGMITLGRHGMYSNGVYPWDVIDRINVDILSGKAVYITTPNKETGKLETRTFRLKQSGDIVLAKDPVDFDEFDRVKDQINSLKDKLDLTGETKGDSPEFKALKVKIAEVCDALQNGEYEKPFKEMLNELRKKAADYYIAKLDQSHNTRRSKRFDISRDIISTIDSFNSGLTITKESALKWDIASKICLSTVKGLVNSNIPQVKARAEKVLSDRELLKKEIKDLMMTKAFKEVLKGKNETELKNFFNKGSKDMLKSIAEKTKELRGKADYNEIESNILKNHEESLASKKNREIYTNNLDVTELSRELGEKNPYGISYTRSGLIALSVCRLLEKGHDLNEILDTTKLIEEKQKTFNEVKELIKEKNAKNTNRISSLFAFGVKKGSEYITNKLEKVDLNDTAFMGKDDNYKLDIAANFLTDCFQEAERIPELKEVFVKRLGGQEKFNEIMMKEINAAAYFKTYMDATESAFKLAKGGNQGLHVEVNSMIFAKSIVSAKATSEAWIKTIKENPNMTKFDVLCKAPTGVSANLLQSYAMEPDVRNRYENIINDNIGSVAIGKAFLNGTFDKTYKLTPTNDNGIKGYRIEGLSESMKKISENAKKAALKEQKVPNKVLEGKALK